MAAAVGDFLLFHSLGPRIYEISTDKGERVHVYYMQPAATPWINHDAKTLGRGCQICWTYTNCFHQTLLCAECWTLSFILKGVQFAHNSWGMCPGALALSEQILNAACMRWEPLDLHCVCVGAARRRGSKYLLNYSNQRPSAAWLLLLRRRTAKPNSCTQYVCNMSSFPTHYKL